MLSGLHVHAITFTPYQDSINSPKAIANKIIQTSSVKYGSLIFSPPRRIQTTSGLDPLPKVPGSANPLSLLL